MTNASTSTRLTDWPRSALSRSRELLPRRADWTRARLGRDLPAGLTVGLVAASIGARIRCQFWMGAGAGLVTAIIAGSLAAIFGGSRVQVSGPTGAMTVVLVPIIASPGPDGVLVVGLDGWHDPDRAGYAKAGKVIRYVPIPVVEGFTLGIAIIIGLQQVPAALGVQVHAEKVLTIAVLAVREWVASPTWVAPGITVAVVAGSSCSPAFVLRFPMSLIVVVILSCGNSLLGWGAATIGSIPSGLPMPSLPSVPFADFGALLLPAIAVAALAALESLLSATVADGMRVDNATTPTGNCSVRASPT